MKIFRCSLTFFLLIAVSCKPKNEADVMGINGTRPEEIIRVACQKEFEKVIENKGYAFCLVESSVSGYFLATIKGANSKWISPKDILAKTKIEYDTRQIAAGLYEGYNHIILFKNATTGGKAEIGYITDLKDGPSDDSFSSHSPFGFFGVYDRDSTFEPSKHFGLSVCVDDRPGVQACNIRSVKEILSARQKLSPNQAVQSIELTRNR